MTDSEVTRELDAPPDRVWALIVADEAMPGWVPVDPAARLVGADEVYVDKGPRGPGAPAESFLRVQPDRHRIEWWSTGPDGAAADGGWLQVSPVGDARSSLTLHLSLPAELAVAVEADPQFLTRTLGEMMDDLAARVT